MDSHVGNTYFFELLQVAVGNRDLLSGVPTAEEWEEIYDISKKQTLAGIAFKGVERLPQDQLPPSRRLRQWFVKADKLRKKNMDMNLECAKTCFLLQKAGFHSCIIKGQANLRNYGAPPQPSPVGRESQIAQKVSNNLGWYRTPGDIDVWVWSDSGEVSDVISFFTARQKDADPHYHHLDCKLLTQIETEVHYRPSWMSAPWRNKVAQEFFDRYKTSVGRFPVMLPDGRKTFFFVPPVEFDAVYQLVHIYRHLFSDGIGLRQMLDYYMVLKKLPLVASQGVVDQTRAREKAMEVISRLGMRRFAAAVMYVLQEVFGMRDEYLLCAPNEKDGRFLLNEIMLAGNFGHADERYTITREESAARWGFMKLRRNMKFMTSYPEEVICEPFFRIFHWGWRRFKLWKY